MGQFIAFIRLLNSFIAGATGLWKLYRAKRRMDKRNEILKDKIKTDNEIDEIFKRKSSNNSIS